MFAFASYLDFDVARVFVEIPDVAVVAIWNSISDNPLVSATVTATFGHDAGY